MLLAVALTDVVAGRTDQNAWNTLSRLVQDETPGNCVDCHVAGMRIKPIRLASQAPNSFCSSPDWYISPMMSEPPTNSPLT